MRAFARLAAMVALGAFGFAGGVFWMQHRFRPATAQQPAVHYACPMHPQYRSDRPGDCPACGMRLEPEQSRPGATTEGTAAGSLPPGTVHVSAEQQQAVGVVLGIAEHVSGTRTLRTTGRVAPDENATYPIVAGASGWVRDVGMATTGTRVRKDEVLASFYSPEFITAQQSYYTGLETAGRVASQQIQTSNERRVAEGLQRFADTLRNLGVSEKQLTQMSHERKLVQDIHMLSPVNGFVLERNISAGLRFDRGFAFYRIADLSRVWILTDVYQHQMPFIRAGMKARITSAQAVRPYTATVSQAEPIFDEGTLTLKVRLECENPGFILKPGMFVDVEMPIEVPQTLVVPTDAIVDSGTRKTVFVDRSDGYFEPRQVETGWRIADKVEVIRGLMPGERIVISGTFLIDSESRMKAAAQGIFGAAAEDPVCGMQVDEKRAAAAGRTVVHHGTTYFFCADDCKHQFERNPGRYLRYAPPEQEVPKPARPALVADARPPHLTGQAHVIPEGSPGTPVSGGDATAHEAHEIGSTSSPAKTAKDPICGMDVVVKEAVAAGRTSQRAGRAYYFCSDSCKKQFDKNPDPTLTSEPHPTPPAAAPMAKPDAQPTHPLHAPSAAPQHTAKDPICGMDVVVKEAVAAGRTSQRDGRTYYFCSDSCKKTFDAQETQPHQ